MRSKEVEEAINQLIVDINFSETGCSTGIIDVKNIETLLAYIEELEKDNIELRKYYATRKEVEDLKDTINCLHESSKEYINKDKIRDKIKELEHEKSKRTQLGVFMLKNYENQRLLAQIEVLKSIIGE